MPNVCNGQCMQFNEMSMHGILEMPNVWNSQSAIVWNSVKWAMYAIL